MRVLLPLFVLAACATTPAETAAPPAPADLEPLALATVRVYPPPFHAWPTAGNALLVAQEDFRDKATTYYVQVENRESSTKIAAARALAKAARDAYVKAATPTPVVVPPPPTPVPPPVVLPPSSSLELVAGAGPVPNPAKEPVAGHALLPIDAARRTSAALDWGGGVLPLNFFEAGVAQHVEFSLDGGPWTATRYETVTLPALADGTHQVRVVVWGETAIYSWPAAPIVLVRAQGAWTIQ